MLRSCNGMKTILRTYSSSSKRRGEEIKGSAHIGQFLIDGRVRIEERCSCRLDFNKKRVPIEGGMHVGSFSIERGCYEKVVHDGKLFY